MTRPASAPRFSTAPGQVDLSAKRVAHLTFLRDRSAAENAPAYVTSFREAALATAVADHAALLEVTA